MYLNHNHSYHTHTHQARRDGISWSVATKCHPEQAGNQQGCYYSSLGLRSRMPTQKSLPIIDKSYLIAKKWLLPPSLLSSLRTLSLSLSPSMCTKIHVMRYVCTSDWLYKLSIWSLGQRELGQTRYSPRLRKTWSNLNPLQHYKLFKQSSEYSICHMQFTRIKSYI